MNLGLVCLVAQYFIGSGIALRYMVLLTRLDKRTERLFEVRPTVFAATPAR